MVKKHSMLQAKNNLTDCGAIKIITPTHEMLKPELMITSKFEVMLFIPEH
jgi:hypothetical protein